jgi:3-oxochol-4-en-24-oyl-CoA dehydrogenase
MSIAITEDHRALADTASDFLKKRDARGAARALLETPAEEPPSFWSDLVNLGWLGLHIPEEYGGAGYSLQETVVVVEELGRAMSPGSFVPTVIASAVINAAADDPTKSELLPGLVDGTLAAGVAITSDVSVSNSEATGTAGTTLGGALADVLVLAAGDDVIVVRTDDPAVKVETPANLDPTRRSARDAVRRGRDRDLRGRTDSHRPGPRRTRR